MFCQVCANQDGGVERKIQILSDLASSDSKKLIVCDDCLIARNLWCSKHRRPLDLMMHVEDLDDPSRTVVMGSCPRCAAEAALALDDTKVDEYIALIRQVCPPDFFARLQTDPAPAILKGDLDRIVIYRLLYANQATGASGIEKLLRACV
jgi:hypothetical protein